MKYAKFFASGRIRIGVLDGDLAYDLSTFADMAALAGFLSLDSPGHELVRGWMNHCDRFRIGEITLLAPIAATSRIFCAALNYADHAAEAGRPLPEEPLLFMKVPSNVIGPYDAIASPSVGTHMDYEAELGLVVGMGGSEISEQDALDHLLGVTVVNDVSARDLQFRSGGVRDFFSGKALDHSTPIGPFVVSLDEAPDLDSIDLRTTVNDELVQEGTTRDLIFSPSRLVSYVSARVALQPWDVIATGTPARLESARGRKLHPGDSVKVSLNGVGAVENIFTGTQAPE